MSQKPQIIYIHGGESFDTDEEFYTFLRSLPFDPHEPARQRWRDWLFAALGDTHECHALSMPNKLNADYTAWSIWFEKMLPFLRDGVTLIGHSLGGSFLLRYLATHELPVTVAAVHLVAPAVDHQECPGLGAFATDLTSWHGIRNTEAAVHLWHSADDTIVPIHHSERLAAVWPDAMLHTFTDRFHFIGEEFPELLAALQ
jgi:predicted alpha/beta hydrolase family esterase